MTGVSKTATRRSIVTALLGLCAAAGLVAYEFPSIFGRRYPKTPFDDLLKNLPDRDAAERLGTAVLANTSEFSAAQAARDLRSRLADQSLSQAVRWDVQTSRLTVVHGWFLPETLTTLCALAAKAA